MGHRRGSDSVLLWLSGRLVAADLIGPLAWEPPYAAGAALKNQNFKETETLLPIVLFGSGSNVPGQVMDN